jgi:heat shock protein HtpX
MKISLNNLIIMFVVLLLTALFDNLIWPFPGQNFWLTIAMQLGIALISISPIGSFCLRLLFGSRKPQTRAEIERLSDLFSEVYDEVKAQYPKIQKNIKYYIDDSLDINAYAIGSNTITVTKGSLMNLSDEELKGILGHEFGHIVNGDTALQSFLLVGNTVFWILWFMAKLIQLVFLVVGIFMDDDFMLAKFFGFCSSLLMNLVFFLVQCLLLINSRVNEFKADKFSYTLGYGEGLLKVLYILNEITLGQKMTVLEKIKSSHPNTVERIGALERMLINSEVIA